MNELGISWWVGLVSNKINGQGSSQVYLETTRFEVDAKSIYSPVEEGWLILGSVVDCDFLLLI